MTQKIHNFTKTPAWKRLLKSIQNITDPMVCEVLIIQLEARKAQLNPNFKSETPRG